MASQTFRLVQAAIFPLTATTAYSVLRTLVHRRR